MAKMRRFAPLASAVVLATAGCIGGFELRAFDELIVAGQDAMLRAKLERAGFLLWRPDVEGIQANFEVLHVPRTHEAKEAVYYAIGQAPTDRDGIAALKVRGFFQGRHIVRVNCPDAAHAAAYMRVFAVTPDIPILVCDIDHTIADVGTVGFLTARPRSVPPVQGSAEALRELSARFLVVYLTARDDSFRDATLSWLQEKGFPEGPVFFSDLSKSVYLGSARRFKTEQLAAWRAAGLNLQAGVGDRAEDAESYLANGMKAFILGSGRADLIPDAVRVGSWQEITRHLSR
jgi:hypothetical protein